MACPDHPLTKTPAQRGYAEGTKIIHHIPWEHHFLKAVGLFVLCILTLGILTPYYFYWTAKYFVNNLEIEA